MASIKQCAADVFDTAQDGIGWIALWKEGRSWNATTIFPDADDYGTDTITVDADYMNELRDILAIDPRAILVNGYYHNLGVSETFGTRDDLAAALQWQYEDCSSRLADYTINLTGGK